jgi:putative chitinase
MNSEQLTKLGIGQEWLEPLNDTFEKYQINTPKRQACFIGQTMHESGGYKFLRENLNYSAKALMNTWPSRFPDMDTAEKYERNPSKIAGKVYAGRMGNTTEEEAQKYIGRGLIQLTGKENYKNCGDGIGVDLLNNPDLLSEPKYAALSAGWFWNKRNLNQYADSNPMDIVDMTKKINGGVIGLEDRKAKINKVIDILNS